MKRILTAFEQLGLSLKIGELQFNGEGYLPITLNDQHTIHCQINENRDAVALYSEVADLTSIKSANLLFKLLTENFLNQDTHQFNFNIHPETHWLLLSRSIDESVINSNTLEVLINNLNDAIITWKKHINDLLQDTLTKTKYQDKHQIPANKFSFISM
ncbi:type III secretion system chaperone [uncultured Shewanella sp.]|uniref:type III secretion system chaperone n=1 Tax=uncultured Shewanella sp. TaxID=173975 RepID=UPI00261742A1|nr:type III secretion system chaperone [uncultured Shewanella sp.]